MDTMNKAYSRFYNPVHQTYSYKLTKAFLTRVLYPISPCLIRKKAEEEKKEKKGSKYKF